MTYYTYRALVVIAGEPRHIEIRAISMESAQADLNETFAEPIEVIQWTQY